MSRHTSQRADWGSVTEVERGKRYRLRYWATVDGVYQRCSDTVRGTRRQAYDRLAELRIEHTQDAPCPTVGECWERWMVPSFDRRVANGKLSVSSLNAYLSSWNAHIAMRWADVPVEDVRALDAQDWLDGMSREAARISLMLLRQTLDVAVKYEIIEANRLSVSLDMPTRVVTGDKGIWTVDQLVDMWHGCEGEWWEAAYILAAFGGCRVGESLGPTARDVRMVEMHGVKVAVVTIERQILKAGAASDRLKNKWSYRSVVVPGPMGERIGEIAARSDLTYLTGDGLGGTCSQDTLNKAWAGFTSAEGRDAHPFHNLRNSWQTYSRWVLCLPPWVTEKLMGHVGEGVTGRNYDRPDWELFADAVAKAYAEHPFGTIRDELGRKRIMQAV